MPGAVSPMSTEYDAGVVPKVHELPPGPERKIFAVAFFSVFEVFWRLPIILFVEKFLIRNVLASCQEFADLLDGMAVNGERLTHITAEWKSGPQSLMAIERAKDLLAFGVIGSRNDFRDHGWNLN
ncbi:MAG: hypothetical protein WCF68_08495 [Terriglobales bacterium]